MTAEIDILKVQISQEPVPDLLLVVNCALPKTSQIGTSWMCLSRKRKGRLAEHSIYMIMLPLCLRAQMRLALVGTANPLAPNADFAFPGKISLQGKTLASV